ncbi:MAG: hypothetical protein ACK5NY_06375 [Burkholderiaceae bacterium]
MSQSKPFHRNYRGIKTAPNSGYSDWAYIVDPEYAQQPEHYTRALSIIQSDLIKLFEFIEPSDINFNTYSYRTHELFMRTCIEIEANFKAILKENIFNPSDHKGNPKSEKLWNLTDYKKINKTHHLSSYKVIFPIWGGSDSTFTPFKEWENGNSLSWYQAYNKSKHDRHGNFKQANFKNLLTAVSGLVVILSSQFRTEDFSPGETLMSLGSNSYFTTEPAIGGFFHIEFPKDWTDDEIYDFNWSILGNEKIKFQKIDFDAIT